MLCIGKQSLANLIATGKIGCLIINKQRKISYSELERFIAENTYYNTDTTDAPVWDNEVTVSKNINHNEYDSDELFNKLKGDILNV